jgi:putative ABC transport system ATP-binding protein
VSPDGVSFRDVSRVYASPAGSVEAVHAAAGEFEAGTIGALVGPSGSGKSTLLRILGGIDVADTGSLRVAGIQVHTLDGGALRRYRRDVVAFVAQRAAANLVPHLTLREQLGPQGTELVDAVGLAHRLDSRSHELSGGEQARAALAAGIARATPVVLLDEPTAELDQSAAERVIDVLRATAATGRTVVVATHDIALVELAANVVQLSPPLLPLSAAERIARTPGEEVVRIVHLTKRYNGAAVVDDASFAVRARELTVLLGRSGSGKSTLLMVAGGWTPHDAGSVHVPGSAWADTAYLPQRFGLLPELSIAENVALPFRGRGVDDVGRVRDILERLGLDGLGDRLPREASIGQQQRTALARAVVAEPKALLADEPTSHQDARSAERVWAALAAARSEGIACLIATHDTAAAAYADRVWELVDGRLV